MEYHYSLTGRMLGIFVSGLVLLAILVFVAGLLAGREWGASEAAVRIKATQRERARRAAPAPASTPVAVGAIGTSRAPATQASPTAPVPASPTAPAPPSPTAPATPASPTALAAPTAPQLSAVPRAPQLSAVPNAPRLPAVPRAPQRPAVPSAPRLSAVPRAPQLSAVPAAPAMPVSPKVTEASKPGSPSQSGSPSQPEKTAAATGAQETQPAHARDAVSDQTATTSAFASSAGQPATVAPTKDEAVHGFVVYVGAFAASNTAQHLADHLQERKLDAHTSQVQRPGRKTLYSVYVGPFSTRAGAKAVLPDLAAAGLDATMIRKVP